MTYAEFGDKRIHKALWDELEVSETGCWLVVKGSAATRSAPRHTPFMREFHPASELGAKHFQNKCRNGYQCVRPDHWSPKGKKYQRAIDDMYHVPDDIVEARERDLEEFKRTGTVKMIMDW